MQNHYSNDVFLDHIISWPYLLSIYSGWSEEFMQELVKQSMILLYPLIQNIFPQYLFDDMKRSNFGVGIF